EGAIPIAEIDLYSEKNEWHTTTDAAGRFSFSELLPGMYEMEVSSRGFHKQIFQNMRIGSSEPAPITITVQVESLADSCVDSFLRFQYVDVAGESSLRGLVNLVSNRNVPEGAGSNTLESPAMPSGTTVS